MWEQAQRSWKGEFARYQGPLWDICVVEGSERAATVHIQRMGGDNIY